MFVYFNIYNDPSIIGNVEKCIMVFVIFKELVGLVGDFKQLFLGNQQQNTTIYFTTNKRQNKKAHQKNKKTTKTKDN